MVGYEYDVCLLSSEHAVISQVGVVCLGPWNIRVTCTTYDSDVQVWNGSGMGRIPPLYMAYGANYTILVFPCNLTLLHTNMSGEVMTSSMTSSMTCPALDSLNGTVITCGTGGGQMNQTTIRFDSCPSSPPPQPGELQIG